MKKKLVAAILCLAMVFAMTACGSSGDKKDTNGTKEGKKTTYKLAMLTDSGEITDQSFNQTTYEACKAFADKNKIDFKYYKPEKDSNEARDASFDLAVSEGYNVIALPGYLFGPTIKKKAKMYPDVKIIALDVSQNDIGLDKVPENVYTAVYQEELSGYMAGYAAVKLGYKHLGFLGGMEVPAVQRFGYGYVQGADAAAKELKITKDVDVKYVYGGQFFGDSDITAYTDTWFKTKGVEVIFACGGGIYTSAAESATKKGVNGKIIGVDSDQKPIIDGTYGKGITVTSAMKGLDVTVQNVLNDIVLNNKWDNYKGKCENLGLVSANPDENYVRLPMDSTQWSDEFTKDDYKKLVADMFDGKIKVSNDTENQPKTEISVDYQGSIKS